MKAVALTERPSELEIVDVAEPVPAADEVVIDVTASGICGSDLTLAKGIAPAGTIMGHEVAGTVRTPDAEGRWSVGQRVAVRPFFGCGSCGECGRGRQDHCEDFGLAGVRRPGGYAEQMVASADELFELPAAVTPAEGALVEPLAIVRHAFRRVDLDESDRVAITGAGPIGIAAVIWARALGIEHIVVSEPDPSRQALAARFGATSVVAPDDLASAVAGAAPQVVLECSGRPGVVDSAMQVAAVDGRVGVVGLCIAQDHYLPIVPMQKEIDLRFCMYYEQQDFIDTLDALDDQRMDVDGFVTQTISLDELPARFAELAASPDGGKVIIAP